MLGSFSTTGIRCEYLNVRIDDFYLASTTDDQMLNLHALMLLISGNMKQMPHTGTGLAHISSFDTPDTLFVQQRALKRDLGRIYPEARRSNVQSLSQQFPKEKLPDSDSTNTVKARTSFSPSSINNQRMW